MTRRLTSREALTWLAKEANGGFQLEIILLDLSCLEDLKISFMLCSYLDL